MKRAPQAPLTLEFWHQEVSNGLITPGKFVQQLPRPKLKSVPDESWEEVLIHIWHGIGPCLACYKADGWRLQIHKKGQQVTLFSRSGKRWNEFAAVAEMISKQVKDDQAILDTEIVGFDENGNHLPPSELLSDRYDHFHCYLLDALYLGGKDITAIRTLERHSFIEQHLLDAFFASFTFAKYDNIDSLEQLINFYRQWQKGSKKGFDGVILKKLDTTYFGDILKLKPQDTVDAVVVGAYLDEKGKASSLLLAVLSTREKQWKPIAKVQKAGSDTEWERVWKACQPFIQNQPTADLDKPSTPPDIWISPTVVAAVTIETVLPGKGYQVRAEHARGCILRQDKGIEEATSFEEMLAMADLPENPLPALKSYAQLQFTLETGDDGSIDSPDKDKEPEAQAPEQEQPPEMVAPVLLETRLSSEKIIQLALVFEE